MRGTWMNVLVKAALMVLVALSAASCGAEVTPSPQPPSFTIPGVTEPEETLPCADGQWQGIRPGLTTEEELQQWLESSPVVNHSTLGDSSRPTPNGLETHIYGWYVDTGARYPGVSVNVISGTVSTISLWPGYPLTLGDVVDELGPPQYMQAEEMWAPDACLYVIDMYYPQRGTAFCTPPLFCDEAERDSGTGRPIVPLSQDVPVDHIACSQGGSIEDVLQDYGLWTDAEVAEHAEHLRDWPGFGMILLWDLWPGP